MTEMLPDRYGTWKPIPSAPGWWASSRGYVKRGAGPSIRRPEFMLPESAPTRGYPRTAHYVINIMDFTGVMKTRSVGRLVCEAFHGPCPSLDHWARHADQNPYNNEASNLSWQHKSVGMKRPRHGGRRGVVRIPRD